MKIYIIITFLIVLIAISALVYYSSYAKLKEIKQKIQNAENIIDENLIKKLDIIINLNGKIKDVTDKKDYLKDYVEIKNYIITNIEKDIKLDEAEKLINDLSIDFQDLLKDKDFMNEYNKLRDVDELLISGKKIFNQNAYKFNQLIKTFPNNMVAKLMKLKNRSFYNTKTDDEETF